MASSQDYWNRNIDKWANFYAEGECSEEEFTRSSFGGTLYNLMIVPLEKRLMLKRYDITIQFVKRYVKPGMTVVDVGCGNGIFTLAMLKQGARVIAVDFAARALSLTRSLVSAQSPEKLDSLDCIELDVTKEQLPRSDIVLAMGITPYVTDIKAFYARVLPSTDLIFCLFLDARHWANRLRSLLHILNVRRANFFYSEDVDQILKEHEFILQSRNRFATGFIDLSVRNRLKCQL
jgi:SAM-dependent methyltransferase